MKLGNDGLLRIGLLVVGLLLCLWAFSGKKTASPRSGQVETSGSPVSPSSNPPGSGTAPSSAGGPRFTTSNRADIPAVSRRPPTGRGDEDTAGRRDRSGPQNLSRLSEGEFEERAGVPDAAPRQRPSGDPNRNPSARSQRPVRQSPLPPEALAGGGLAGELESLDRGFEAAQNLLFGGFRGGGNPNPNPFDQGNDGTPDPNSDPPATDGTDNGDGGDTGDGDSSGGDGGDDGGAGDGSDGSGGDNSPPPDTTAPEPVFDFLLVGRIGSSPDLVARAAFNGSDFILENGVKIGFFPGSFHNLFSFGPESLLLIEDINGDGRDDLLRAREVPSVGTSVEMLEQDDAGSFHLTASAALYLERVVSMVLFDIEGDGQLELLLGLHGKTRLFVYERSGTTWDYSREYALPAAPGLMFVSREGSTSSQKLLYIIDPKLQLVLNARSASPVGFSFGLGTPLQRIDSIAVDFLHTGGNPAVVRTLQMQDRLLLFEMRDQRPVSFANLERGEAVPVLVIGDYSGRKQRDILWLP